MTRKRDIYDVFDTAMPGLGSAMRRDKNLTEAVLKGNHKKAGKIIGNTAGEASFTLAIAGVSKGVNVAQSKGLISKKVKISSLKNNPKDPFTDLKVGPKPGKVNEYIGKIKKTGKYEPIDVTKWGNGQYQIENGHHRIAALKSLGKKKVKVKIIPQKK